MARPGRHCPVCDADPITRTKIESLRETGRSYREINALISGFDVHKISRHFKHVGKAAAEVTKLSPLEKSERRLAELSERAEASWLAAVSSADPKVAWDVLKSQIRVQLDHHARLVEQAEEKAATEATDKDSWPTPAQFDNVLAKVRAIRARDLAPGMCMCPICNARPVTLEQIQFFRSHDVHVDSAN
jgi:hypothetical protein